MRQTVLFGDEATNVVVEAAKSTATPKGIISPRDYQQEAIRESFRLWESLQGVIVRSPTGSGKTITGSLIADRWLQQGDDCRVIVVAHERQLIHQFAEEIEDVLGITPGVEMGSEHVKPHEIVSGKTLITVASRQTLMPREKDGQVLTRLGKFPSHLRWLLVIDECHRWAYSLRSCEPILKHFGEEHHRRLGITATPFRTDKTSLGTMFPGVALDYRHYDPDGGRCAIRDGWAVPYEQHLVRVEGVDLRRLEDCKSQAEEEAWLESVLGDQKTVASLVEPTLDIVGDLKTIVFCPTINVSRMVAAYICAKREDDMAAVHLDGSFKDHERKQVYQAFERGDFQFLCVVGLCREGYNCPSIGAVAVFRPTKSRSLAEQMKGRGCRPLRGVVNGLETAEERRAAIAASDKPVCRIVDLVGISGMPPAGSTVSLFAEGKEDEVVERANKKVEAGETDVVKAVQDAEEEIKREREEARRRREIEEQRRVQRRTRAKVKYKGRVVGDGYGTNGSQGPRSIGDAMTDPQRRYLWVLGFKDIDQYEGITKQQARNMISQIKSGVPVERVKKNKYLRKRNQIIKSD